MDELERLRAEVFIARNRVSELQHQLQEAQTQLRDYAERLTLSECERSVLQGREDGCVRVNELLPILRRVFKAAA